MSRPVTLFTGQWADLPLESVCQKAKSFGYDGLELACWGDHFEVSKANDAYCKAKHKLLDKYGLKVFSISNHLVGQAVADRIDERHKGIVPDYVWGDGKQEGVRKRAAEEMIKTAEAAKRFGVSIVNGFTGSPIWHLAYSFPPNLPKMIDDGFKEFVKLWKPILDAYKKLGIRFALEVHPTEIAFDIASARRALEALNNHPCRLCWIYSCLRRPDISCPYEGCRLVGISRRSRSFRRAHRIRDKRPLLGFQESGPG
jgi:sugar phosphate isomerase/epimerase